MICDFQYDLRKAMKKRGHTQADLVRSLHITRAAICRWYNGERYPRYKYRVKLARLYPELEKWKPVFHD